MKRFSAALLGFALIASPGMAAKKGDVRVSGQGTIEDGRTFSLSAVLYQDGTVKGQATLINRNFSGDSGKGPFKAHFDISCVRQLDDNTLVIGGFANRINDANLVDAVFFSLRDDGKDDLLSRAFFFDGDPNTTGDPSACQISSAFPMEEVIRGNINVH
jgi:hypothetical protein